MQEKSAAVIVAAGSSRRMQGQDKLWLPLGGRVTLAHTVDVFQVSSLINTVVLVVNQERLKDAQWLRDREGWDKVTAIIPGGERRQDSVRNGLDALARMDPACRWVMIHDGARPFVTAQILEEGLRAALEHQAAIAAVAVKDTTKVAQDGIVSATLDRAQLWAVQTPQIFAFPLIREAYDHPVAQEDVTDEASILENLGYPVSVFPGSYTNIKITTPEDLIFAEAFLEAKMGSGRVC